jgi:hypothetical protein
MIDIANSEDVKQKYFEGENYILRYRDVYQLNYSQAQQRLTYNKLYHKADGGVGITLRGRFIQTGDTEWVNKLVGFELVKEN